MRIAVAAALVSALLAAPYAAAEVDPSRLVLRQADVPSGYRLDGRTSGVRTNESESRAGAEARRLIARSARTTGYETEFDGQGGFAIESRADLFRGARGARMFLDWLDAEMRKAGIAGVVRTRVGVGSGGWLYTGRTTAAFVLIAWRHDRVFAGVVATGLSKARVVALARVQQRRIASALR